MFRFTIRDVLWLMVVVAVAACWLVEYRGSQQKSRQLQDAAIKAEEMRVKIVALNERNSLGKQIELFIQKTSLDEN